MLRANTWKHSRSTKADAVASGCQEASHGGVSALPFGVAGQWIERMMSQRFISSLSLVVARDL